MTQSYNGSCHCGAVQYSVETELKTAIECNCSICERSGTLLAFAPESRFTLKQGGDNLTDYQFNKHKIHHLFCKTCGVKSFSKAVAPDGTPTVAINIRCLEGVDIAAIPRRMYDGRAL
jgi:hypothetical protein